MDVIFLHLQKKVKLRYLLFMISLSICLFFTTSTFSQQNNNTYSPNTENASNEAPVKLDGHTLFSVRGVSSFPAEQRASEISQRIKNVAETDSVSATNIKIVHHDEYSTIYFGENNIISIFDAEAKTEGVSRAIIATTVSKKISSAITSYRLNRSKPVILKNLLYALLSTVLLVIVLFILIKISKKINTGLQNRIKAKIDSVENISFNLIKSNLEGLPFIVQYFKKYFNYFNPSNFSRIRT